MRQRYLNGEAGGDNTEEGHHKRFHPAKSEALHPKNDEHVERRDDDPDLQGYLEEQIETDRSPDDFGKVCGAYRHFRDDPQRHRHGAWKGVPAGLRQIALCADTEPRAQRLQQNGHQI